MSEPLATDPRSEGLLLRVALLAGGVLMVVCNTPLAPTLPQIRDAFAQASALQVSMVLTLPALMIVLTAPLAGWIVDRYGRKRLLVLTALLYGLAGGSGYLVQNMDALLATRALVGVAVAGLMTSVAALISDCFQGERRARFMGLSHAATGFGNTAFLLAGGALAESGWRTPFLMYLATLLLLPLFAFSLYEPQGVRRTSARNGPPFPSTLAALFSDGGRQLAGAPDALRRMLSDAGLDGPLLRLLLFTCGLVGLSQVVYYLIPLQLPFWLQARHATTPAQSGLAIATLALAFAVTALVYGRIASRVAHVPLVGLALAALGGSYVLISLAPTFAAVYAGLIVTGTALGFILPSLNLWLANRAPAWLRGRLLGAFSASIFLGHFISPLVLPAPTSLPAMGQLWQDVGLALMLFGGLLVLLHAQLARLF